MLRDLRGVFCSIVLYILIGKLNKKFRVGKFEHFYQGRDTFVGLVKNAVRL